MFRHCCRPDPLIPGGGGFVARPVSPPPSGGKPHKMGHYHTPVSPEGVLQTDGARDPRHILRSLSAGFSQFPFHAGELLCDTPSPRLSLLLSADWQIRKGRLLGAQAASPLIPSSSPPQENYSLALAPRCKREWPAFLKGGKTKFNFPCKRAASISKRRSGSSGA